MMTAFEDYISSLQRFGIQPGLERIYALLDRLGQPHLRYAHVLVGGTNGKGSTCEFLARMLATNGERVGVFTSPHLYRWNERLRVVSAESAQRGGLFPDAISDETLDELFFAARPHLDAVKQELGQPTEFETLTALGLWHFARAGVDCAVIEVGLGGKWDATNAADPLVSVVTHVALDHMDRLGDTVEAIARDKVQIARPGRAFVTAETKDSVLAIFREYCGAIGAKLERVEALDAPNAFQQINLQTARAAFGAFNAARGKQTAVPDIALAVPGRYEVIEDNPRVIVDVCNNPDGAEHLARAVLDDESIKTGPDGNLILILGILADKDYAAMTATLAPLARCVIATQSSSPRAAAAKLITQQAIQHAKHVETIVPIQAAMHHALEVATPSDTILIAGSFTTVGEIERQS